MPLINKEGLTPTQKADLRFNQGLYVQEKKSGKLSKLLLPLFLLFAIIWMLIGTGAI